LEEAKAEHQVESKLGGEWIALEKSAEDSTSGLTQTRIIHGHTHETPAAKGKGLLENRLEEILGMPGSASMEAVVSTPIEKVASFRPQSARKSASAEGGENAQSLAKGTAEGTGLPESRPPGGGDIQPASEQHRAPVFHHTK